MKLKVSKRAGKTQSELTQLRYKTDIPGVIYNIGQKGTTITVNGSEFATILRTIKKGYLPTTIFELDLDGKISRAIVKDIQYHPTTYRVIHLDFQVLYDDTEVDIRVPITFSGVAECVGVKLGGFIRQIIYHAKVRCLPKNILSEFTIDVRSLAIGEAMRIGDIKMSEGIRSLIPEKEIVVVIAKR